MTDDSWGQVRNELLKALGKNNFVTWIEPLRLAGLKDGIARFDVPTNFMRDWVSRNFAEQIRQHLLKAGEEVDRVEFHVPATRPVPANDVAAATGHGDAQPERPSRARCGTAQRPRT